MDTQKNFKQNTEQKPIMCSFQSISGYNGTRMVLLHSFMKTTTETGILFG